MTDSGLSARSPWWHTLVVASLAATLLVAAAGVMFSAFMVYDDEGYVLLSLRNYFQHGGLYRDVYSQYGPFPFVLYAVLQELGLNLTHTVGRALALVAWAGTALFCAGLVRQATRSLLATSAVLAGVFSFLWVMANEPSHPGGLIALLTAAGAALGYRWIAIERTAAWAALTGAIVAALALTKINVGGFAGLAAVAWMGLHARSGPLRRIAPGALVIGAVLLPLVLMRPLLAEKWVQVYALVFACSAIAAVLAISVAADPRCGRRELGWMLATGAALSALVLGAVTLRHTAFRDLLEGIILGPLRHPGKFSGPFAWGWATGCFAVGSLAVCGAALILRRRANPRVDAAVALLRIVALLGFMAALASFPEAMPDRKLFGWAPACAWLFLWPLPGGAPSNQAARAWLGLLFLGQFLHAFPVAGSQIAWGTLLALPLAAIGAWEAMQWLAERFPAARGLRLARLTAAAITIAFTMQMSVGLGEVARRYESGSDLALPGAHAVRIPSKVAATLQIMALNASVHSDMIFSEPGMFSFNLWTGLPTPTLSNVTHWFSLLPDERQQAIVRALAAHPDACVIMERAHIEFLQREGYAPAGPLHDYIARNFTPAFTLSGFEFHVRKGRVIAPLMLGDIRLRRGAGAGTDNAVLQIRLVLPPQAVVARIELDSNLAGTAPFLVFDAAHARLEVTPMSVRGAPLGPARAAHWPLQLAGPADLAISFDRFAQPRPIAGGLIRLLAADGSEIALARLTE